MGTTALVFHLEGPSLVSLTNSSSPQKTASSPLALPYRFPKSSSPLAAISPAGHVYLYAQGGSHVWEYDALGRRVSEMSFTNGHVHRVLSLGKEVIVALQGGIRVMEKEGGKWRQINVLEVSHLLSQDEIQAEELLRDQWEGLLQQPEVGMGEWSRWGLIPGTSWCTISRLGHA